MRRFLAWGAGFVGLALVLAASWHLHRAASGVDVTIARIGDTPVTVFRRPDLPRGPAVVIAHGFAGSQQLMRSLALSLAHAGLVAVTYDLLGHGRNSAPLGGSLTETHGATRRLVDELARVAALARAQGDGRLAVLGHSMASDIVVRFAREQANIDATVAISMFSPAVTATEPRNLLMITGAWEGALRDEALRALGLATAPRSPGENVTYGTVADGTARRAAVASGVEHIGVLFAVDTLRETADWLRNTFALAPASESPAAGRGLWILALMGGIILLAAPVTQTLPRLSDPPAGAGLPWRRLWPVVVVPAIMVPVVLRFVPTHFLPVVVGDYLAVHFATMGIATGLLLWRLGRLPPRPPGLRVWASAAALAAAVVVPLAWAIDAEVTSFWPGEQRLPLLAALLIGTLSWALADEWATRGPGAGFAASATTKAAFVCSLAIAVALDFERLFFLILIVPVIIPYFIVFGVVSWWAYAKTGEPAVGGAVNAVMLAWAIGVTFPMLAG